LREHEVEVANAPMTELVELSRLVEELDPDASGQDDLDELLDRYGMLAIARQRCVDALMCANRPKLEAQLVNARVCHPRAADVLERRLAHVVQIEHRLAAFDDALATVADVIRHYSERARLPAEAHCEPELIGNVIDRIDAYDTVDAETTNSLKGASHGQCQSFDAA
jgi:hypothetical protein